jgi:DNA-binding transcriptional LysR family regulator
MPLDLRALRQLLALADHGSFGRAATALRMTQPALSRSMKALEAEVGAGLFERSATGAVPTDEGRLLIERARELVRAADELDRELLRRRVPGAGQIAVGAGPYPGETIVPAALTRFMAAHPLVRVRVIIRGDWDELLRRLRARELDFFVAETSTLDAEHDLDIDRLPPHPAYFIGRRDHPLADRATVRAEHTFSYPFLALSRYPPRVLQPMLATRQASDARQPGRPFPAIELASLHAVKQVLLDSDAIAPLTLPCVADELERGTLVVLATEWWVYTGYGIVRLKGHAPGAAALRFCECVREAEAALVRQESQLVALHSPGHDATAARRARKRGQ